MQAISTEQNRANVNIGKEKPYNFIDNGIYVSFECSLVS